MDHLISSLAHPAGTLTIPSGKSCHRCGVDLTHKVRYRDQSGYWCVTCSKADKKAYRANHLPCDDCGADIRRGQEIATDDLRLCSVCSQKRQVEAVRMRLAREAQEALATRRRQRLRSIRNWSIVAAELIAAAVVAVHLSRSGTPGHNHLATSRPTRMPMADAVGQVVRSSSSATTAQTLP